MKDIKMLDIPIEDIEDNPFYPRRFEEFDVEDIKRMSKSFERSGLLNAIIVREVIREIDNNKKIKYQLITGKRRMKAFKLTGKKIIPARIVEADDVEVQIMSLAENYHRKDLSISEKENYIYKLWNNGNEKGIFHNNLSIMEDWTGVPHQVLSDVVNAFKEKEQDDSEVVRLASSKDLQRTRGIKDTPKIRKLLLEGAVIKKTIKVLELENLVKEIKKAKEENLKNDILYSIVELAIEKRLNTDDIKNIINFIIILNEEDQQKIIEKLKRDAKSAEDEAKINIFALKNFIDIYQVSHEDVKEKLLNNNISIKEAIELNKFNFRDQREKVLTDLRLYDHKITEIEKEKYSYLKKRTQHTKETENTDIDKYLDNTKIFKSPEEEELKLVDKIVKIKKELFHFDFDKINKLNPVNQNFAIEFLWEIYNKFHRILVDLGEIKVDINVEENEDSSNEEDDLNDRISNDRKEENVEEVNL